MKNTSKSFKTSNWETYVHLVKGNVGAGCLALPFCFSMLGPFWSAFGLMATGSLCVYNMWLVVHCKRLVLDVDTYGELGFAAFGKDGEALLELLLIMMQLSVCCVYFTFIGSNINGLLPGGGSLFCQKIIITLIVIPIAAISQIKSIRKLAPLSLVATVLILSALSTIFFLCFSEMIENERLIIPPPDFSKGIAFFTIIIYAFEGVGLILPIEHAMQRPQDFGKILLASMSTVGFIFILLAESSILAYGIIDDGSMTSFLAHRSSSSSSGMQSTIISAVNILISGAVLLTYPLQLYPAVQVLEVTFQLVKPETVEPEMQEAAEESGPVQGRLIKNFASASMRSFFAAGSGSPVYKKLHKTDRFGHKNSGPHLKFRTKSPHTSGENLLEKCKNESQNQTYDTPVNVDSKRVCSKWIQVFDRVEEEEELDITAVEDDYEEDEEEEEEEGEKKNNSHTPMFRAVSDTILLPTNTKKKIPIVVKQVISPLKALEENNEEKRTDSNGHDDSNYSLNDAEKLKKETLPVVEMTTHRKEASTSFLKKYNIRPPTEKTPLIVSTSNESLVQLPAQTPGLEKESTTIYNQERKKSSSKPLTARNRSFASLLALLTKPFTKTDYSRELFRIILVLSTALVAILVPNVGLLVSLAGATSGAALSLIIPPLIDWKLSSKVTLARHIMNTISLVVGVIAAIVGTTAALVDIFRAYS